MTISVIIPIYNGKQYISKLLEMLGENLRISGINYNLEVIFVNDSPENPIDKIMSKSNQMEIKIIANDCNRGIHYSRVAGLRYSSGEYVLFLDQDDEIANNYFESQLLRIGNKDYCISNGMVEIGNGSKYLYRYRFMQWTVLMKYFYIKYDCRIISPGQCLIRKDSIQTEWYNNIVKTNGADDYYLWLLMMKRKRKATINRNVLYTHKNTDNNASLDLVRMKTSIEEVLGYCSNILSPCETRAIRKRISKKRKPLLVSVVERINKK